MRISNSIAINNNPTSALGGRGATGYIVDDYDPEYCWTVERVKTTETDLVLVRRSSDSAELAFTGAEISDGTLTTWTGANDGFVVTWYNQGNAGSLDLTQATASKQPKLVSSGVVLTKNSKPSVLFDGTDDENSSSTQILNTVPLSFFGVGSEETSSEIGVLFSNRRAGTDLGGFNILIDRSTNKYGPFFDTGSTNFIYNNSVNLNNNTLRLQTFTCNASDEGEYWRDSVSQETLTMTTTYNVGSTKTIMLGGQKAGATFTNTSVSMILLWDTDETSNRTDIETDINSIYSIY